MTEPGISRDFERAVEILLQRRFWAALTGAGLSTRSGIPDFRSPDTGIWTWLENMPEESSKFMSLQGFQQDPETFYSRFRPMLKVILEAQPNPAHFALATLERIGKLRAVITQNGDMLHHKAGSQQVFEVHGTIATATCIGCYKKVDGLPLWEALIKDGRVPQCKQCGAFLKPDVILPGEQLPRQVLASARQAVRDCDAWLVAGTSLSGGPVQELLEVACRQGAQVVIINLSPTILDSSAAVTIRADVTEALPALADRLLHA